MSLVVSKQYDGIRCVVNLAIVDGRQDTRKGIFHIKGDCAKLYATWKLLYHRIEDSKEGYPNSLWRIVECCRSCERTV